MHLLVHEIQVEFNTKYESCEITVLVYCTRINIQSLKTSNKYVLLNNI